MWVSVAFTTISVLGEAFLIRFLIALLRESRRFTGRRRVRFKLERKRKILRYATNDDVAWNSASDGKVRDQYAALFGSEIHAKESSRLITLAVLPGAGHVGRRSKPGDISVFRQRWFIE
jgi:hypothetical protein